MKPSVLSSKRSPFLEFEFFADGRLLNQKWGQKGGSKKRDSIAFNLALGVVILLFGQILITMPKAARAPRFADIKAPRFADIKAPRFADIK